MRVISPFLLYGAEAHLRRLQEMTTDSVVNEVLWKEMLGRITDEWRDFIIYVRLLYLVFFAYHSTSKLNIINVQATVLLNANVAFLAIQSVDISGPVGPRSSAQKASYLSIVNSVGTIILGLLLVREHNTSLSVRRTFFLMIIQN